MPKLTEVSKLWEDTRSSCQVRVKNRDARKYAGNEIQQQRGCCDFAEQLPAVLTLTKDTEGTLQFTGTRTDLEDQYLDLRLHEDAALICGKRPLRSKVPFQGVLDYGHMHVSFEGVHEKFDAQGEVEFRPPGPAYRQVGNLGRC